MLAALFCRGESYLALILQVQNFIFEQEFEKPRELVPVYTHSAEVCRDIVFNHDRFVRSPCPNTRNDLGCEGVQFDNIIEFGEPMVCGHSEVGKQLCDTPQLLL